MPVRGRHARRLRRRRVRLRPRNFSAGLDSLYLETFLRTLRTAAVGTLLIILVGYPLAYWIARYAPENRRGLFLALIIVPFWTSFLIRTYSFLIVLSPEFFLSDWLQSLRLTDGPLDILYTTSAIQIGLVYNYLPLFVLPLYATLERMDWRLIDAAKDLGASEWAAFRQITLRLTAPGLVTGTLLVFIPMMGEYVIPLMLGGGRVDFIGNIDPAPVPRGAGLRARLGAVAAGHGRAVVLRRRSTSTSRRARSRSTVAEALRKTGAFVGALPSSSA